MLAGCDGKAPSTSNPPALPKVVAGDGVIRGKVTFTGTPPEMRVIANAVCHPGVKEPIKEESVVVNTDGSLRHVFVFLKGVAADAPMGGPSPLIDQVGCRYVPHVVGVQAGQPLTIRTSDPAIHNVHFTPTKNPADNLNMPGIGDERKVTFANPEFIRFKCDVHPWMSAYVGVFPSPFFTTTGDTGTFELTQLPAGTYMLAVWHERFGEMEKQVTIADGKPLTVDFTFAP